MTRPTGETAAEFLGPKGPIARLLPNYEARSEQIDMAVAAEKAISRRKHLVVEAGTGVGKTFAYLVPLIFRERVPAGVEPKRDPVQGKSGPGAAAHELDDELIEEPEPDAAGPLPCAIVSTHTINLQEQLIAKDIPFLKSALPDRFNAVLAKGRSNFVCMRRLANARVNQSDLFSSDTALDDLGRIVEWAGQTKDGSRSDMDWTPSHEAWEQVCSEQGNCLGWKCRFRAACHYQRMRAALRTADIVVVNHALFFADLALRDKGGFILPPYDVVVLDEAHTLETAARDHLGYSVSSAKARFLLYQLYNPRRHTGFLARFEAFTIVDLVEKTLEISSEFFAGLREKLASAQGAQLRVRQPELMPDTVSPHLQDLRSALDKLRRDLAVEGERFTDERQELAAYSAKCLEIADGIRFFLAQSDPDHAYWLESAGYRGADIACRSAPVVVAKELAEKIFTKIPTAILTSATLSLGKEPSFEYIKSQVGLESPMELRLGSPFDFRRQATLFLSRSMPDPNDKDGFELEAAARMLRHIKGSRGRAFILFTSYDLMDRLFKRLAPELEGLGINVLRQGDGLPRHLMLASFKEKIGSVIFGADSFWQGVDVPGEALENVIITKLPFPVPSDPLVEAK
ncbi:MAG: helicase C-terminal domain-containing protein, partial [Planctomycetota bacterium]|nr:helicase C-terminal domain-containing protein [Planctomycetota bacterium]